MADLLLGQVLRFEGDPMVEGEGAARHDSHGAVLVDPNYCIGCAFCVQEPLLMIIGSIRMPTWLV